MAELADLYTALGKAQAAMQPPKRTQTAKVQTRTGPGYTFSYAPLDEIFAVARQPLADNGLHVQQGVIWTEGRPLLRTTIAHTSGGSISNDYPVITGGDRAQDFGGAITYARRYGLMLALALAAEDDDDGNTAEQQHAVITPRRPFRSNGDPLAAAPAGNGAAATSTPPSPTRSSTGDNDPFGLGPAPIPVLVAANGSSDWIDWGGKLVRALQACDTRSVAEAWLDENMTALGNCERDAPKVHERLAANIATMRQRLPDFLTP